MELELNGLNIEVWGMGHALPSQVLTNRHLESMVQTSSDWIIERTGIRERRIAGSEFTNAQLCYQAAQMALNNAGIKADQLDLIVVATVTPDMVFPSTACLIQEKLGARHAAALDLEAGCTGFIYALTMAEAYLLAGKGQYALVIGADLLSKITDYNDRNTCILFGDGAGAFVLAKGHHSFGIVNTYLGADGNGSQMLYMPAGGSLYPPSKETIEQNLHYIRMNGNEVFRFASRIVVEVSDHLLASSGLSYQDIDLFVPHQANLRIIQTAMKRMDIPLEKTLINIDRYGNMSSATIPVALSEVGSQGLVKENDLILMVAFGAGLTYGGALLRWGRSKA